MKHRWVFLLASGVALLGQDLPQVRELERLGEGGREVLVLGLDAQGFDKLRGHQRKFAYYLYRAAIAGNDIAYLQTHRYALDIKELFEVLYAHREGLDADTKAGIEDYLKQVWVNHGQYRHWTHSKFVPAKLDFAQLQKAVKAAKKGGAQFHFSKGEPVERVLVRLKPHIFDLKVEPVLVNQAPGQDPIKTSASGLYDPGLTLKEIQALPQEAQTRLNVRFARKGKRAVAEPFKIGGVYGEQLDCVAFWLRKASQYVDNEMVEREIEKGGVKVKKMRYEPVAIQKKAVDELVAYYETGDLARFQEHCVAWVQTKGAVDFLNGFHEVYKDPRAVVGSFEANVSLRQDSEPLDRLSQNAFYFEGKMPWKDAWKRAKVEPPVAISVQAIVETGDAGPISPAAYNLPNANDFRKLHGSKNVVLQNVMLAESPEIRQKTLEAFYLPEDQELIRKHGDQARLWQVYLHEVIGHGSGQPDASLGSEDPSVKLGGVYNALEECRAEAVALYQAADPKLAEIGAATVADQPGMTQAMYLQLLTRQLRANGEATDGVLRSAHRQGGQAILNYLIQPGKDFGTSVIQRDGHFYVQVSDAQKARIGVGEILEKLQTFKSMGDRAGAEAFFEQFGSQVNPDWQKDAQARIAAIGRPRETAFVFPALVPVVEEKDGREVLKEVRLESKETLAEQMLRYRAWARSRELAPK
ncbi:dipeptidyl-peptidase III [Holophaga foetida]|uniref:dipeptidyl-peptidase III n=1 Tax=Holophaga foetida TaxID=35839 RepID=UPI0002474671|nr:dipeptidyl-peptidase III [Holophaga foetida]